MSSAHWVTELFPPTFGFTLAELENRPVPDEAKENSDEEEENKDPLSTYQHRKEKKTPLTEFEKRLAHHISPDDIAAIKNVYQRVWLMNRMKGEAENPLSQPGDQPYKNAQTCTSDLASYWEDDSIWSTSEIGVLRQVFREAQKQNTVLSARVQGQDEEYQRLKTKQQQQQTDLLSATSQLQEVRKANKRLQILSSNLKKTVDETRKQVQALEREIFVLQQERKENLKVIHEQQIVVNKERIMRKRIEQDLSNKDSEVQAEMKLNEDKLEILHQKEVKKLQNTIGKLQEALANEVKDHQRTKKGLDVLRNHFASLPYAGEEDRKKMVVKDELSTWTH